MRKQNKTKTQYKLNQTRLKPKQKPEQIKSMIQTPAFIFSARAWESGKPRACGIKGR